MSVGRLVGAVAFGRGGLILSDLFGLFGGKTRLLGGFRVGFGLDLRLLFRALGGEPCPFLLGLLGLFGRGDAGILSRDLVELKFGEACIEAVGILREEGIKGGAVADLQRQFVIPARLSLGIGCRRGRCGRRRYQRYVLAAERAIDKRLLAVAGILQHVIAHEAERPAYVEARRRQMFCKRDRERAVLGIAVECGRTRLCGIGDQHVRAGRFDLGKAAPDRARGNRPLHLLGKGIVAAGVKDHQPKLLGGFDRDQHPVQRKGLVVDVGVALQFRVNGNQIIRAIDLHAVAGVIDHGDVGVARGIGEVAQRPARLDGRKIVAGIDDVEAGTLQSGRHDRAVIDGVRERRHVLIGRITDDQCHPFSRPGRLAHQEQRGGKEESAPPRKSRRIDHDTSPTFHSTRAYLPEPGCRPCEPDHEPGSRPVRRWNLLHWYPPAGLGFALCYQVFSVQNGPTTENPQGGERCAALSFTANANWN